MKATKRDPDQTILDAALQYAARGWEVFPARFVGNEKKSHKAAKHSNGRAWGKTTDADEIRRDFQRWPRAGVAIATGAVSGLFVIETDTVEGHGVDGAAALRVLEAEHGALPDTLMAESPTGSRHRYFRPPNNVKIKNCSLAAGVDVKGDGGMVIAPPSVRPGKGEYRWLNNNTIADAPDWLLKLVMDDGDDERQPNPDKQAEIERVIAYLAIIPNDPNANREFWARIGLAANAANRDFWITVGMATRAATAGSDDGFAAFNAWSRRYGKYDADKTALAWKGFKPKTIGAGSLDHLAKEAWPGWEDDPSAIPVIKAFAAAVWDGRVPPERPGTGQPTGSNQDEPSDPCGPPVPEEELLALLNAEYCVVQDSGKTRILRFDLHEQVKGTRVVHRRPTPTYFTFGDFHNFHKNKKVLSAGKPVPLGNWWTSHERRRSYKGLVFRPDLPDAEVNGRLNLWRGFGVEPKAGDWSLMRQHIREVIAAGNLEHDTYIINWLGWAVQHPAEPTEVALVLKGGRGVGKGTLGNAMVRIFGQHATHISSVKHLVGHFNVHLRDACLLFADEAYWPGDKRGEGELKRLITEPTLFIEPKFVDAMMVPNMLHVLMASNEDWIVPAGEFERRYAVFEVSEQKRQDQNWFGPLNEQLEHGGYQAMLHDLLQLDLGDWHPRAIPMTEALRKQQLRSLAPLDAWILKFLEDGVLPMALGIDRPSRAVSRSQADIASSNPRNGLYDIAREQPALRYVDEQVLAEHLKQWGCKPWRNRLIRGWEFPPLAECRAGWEQKFPGWVWQHPGVTEWESATLPSGRLF